MLWLLYLHWVLLHLISCAIWFSFYDIRYHLIRNRDLKVALICLAPFVEVSGLISGISNFIFYLLVFLFSRGAIGFGDVKLSFMLGIYLGNGGFDISKLFLANFISWLAALAAIVLLRSLDRQIEQGRIAFAPFLFIGTGIEVVFRP